MRPAGFREAVTVGSMVTARRSSGCTLAMGGGGAADADNSPAIPQASPEPGVPQRDLGSQGRPMSLPSTPRSRPACGQGSEGQKHVKKTDPHLPWQQSFHPLPGSWRAGPAARIHSSPRHKCPPSLKKRQRGPIKQSVNCIVTLLSPPESTQMPCIPTSSPGMTNACLAQGDTPGSASGGPHSFLVLQAPFPLRCFPCHPFFRVSWTFLSSFTSSLCC